MITIKDRHIFQFSNDNTPVNSVKSNTTILFKTRDCFDNQLKNENDTIDALDWSCINPATGPVYIEDALPGDTLKIDIQSIEVDNSGIMVAIPTEGILGNLVEKGSIKRIPVKEGYAYFSEDIVLPCNPMIGVIGVAPAGEAIPCGEPGSHGGNMDNTRIAAGSTLYLPVYHKGALLALGDVHACMGDGEIMVSGLEIPAAVQIKVNVIKDIAIQNPRLENDSFIYTIASHEDIETAIHTASLEMAQLLVKHLGLTFNDAGMLLSACGNLRFCQVVDPKRTVCMEIPKRILSHIL